MDVAIAGGHGKIALRLTRLLRDRGDSVRSLIRNPDHSDDVPGPQRGRHVAPGAADPRPQS